MQKLIHHLLLQLPPEMAHHLSLNLLPLSGLKQEIENDPVKIMGLSFKNRIGLAAGLDKDAQALSAWENMGLGHIEVGTVTPFAQPGNAKPRLFRLREDYALINRMGFNNQGIDHLVNEIEYYRLNQSSKVNAPIIGVNIGKNAMTPIEKAVNDYLICFHKAYFWADYIAINISSPNTKNLRDLQAVSLLRSLLLSLKDEQNKLNTYYQKYTPIVVKIAPDMSDEQVMALADLFLEIAIDGVIACNTTIARAPTLQAYKTAKETGGLSGMPLNDRSTEVIKKLYQTLGSKIPIIASGGVMSAKAAEDKISAGAQLVQVYTGLIYHGPELVQEINQALCSLNRNSN